MLRTARLMNLLWDKFLGKYEFCGISAAEMLHLYLVSQKLKISEKFVNDLFTERVYDIGV